jgi:hypothetical protein
MRLHAERVAQDLMRGDQQIEWSVWHVEVYDEKGWSLLKWAFTDVSDARRMA